MKIGIDLSPLQGSHRMRGIGYTLINFINGLSEAQRSENHFIFFVMPYEDSDFGNPLELIDLKKMSYEVRPLKLHRKSSKKLPGRLQMLVSVYNNMYEIKDLYLGDSRISNLNDVEVFLQTDQTQSLPRKHRLKKVLIVYDIIPYTVEWDYLWSYRTARKVHGFSRKAAFRCYVRRKLYLYKIKLNVRRANLLIAISEQTAAQFKSAFKLPDKKVAVTPLGVNFPPDDTAPGNIKLYQYVKTSWGYSKRTLKLDPKVPFILFVGGADKRRKLADLVTAFNALRAQGINFKLILAGDSMQGPNNVATEEIQHALKSSSYLKDIIFMGFIDDHVRDWLYKNARSFVFPSKYEGFGLPVLEAMAHQCPVISYVNDATYEVAGDFPIYADNIDDLKSAILKLLNSSEKEIDAIRTNNLSHAKKYSWVKTADRIISQLENTL